MELFICGFSFFKQNNFVYLMVCRRVYFSKINTYSSIDYVVAVEKAQTVWRNVLWTFPFFGKISPNCFWTQRKQITKTHIGDFKKY